MPRTREIGDAAIRQPPRMIGLRPILSDSQPNSTKPAAADGERPGHQQVAGEGIDLQDGGQEEQRVELPVIPDHGLARVMPSSASSAIWRSSTGRRPRVSGASGMGAFRLHLQERRTFLQRKRIHTEIPSSRTETRNGTRQPHVLEGRRSPRMLWVNRMTSKRQQQAQGGSGLDPTGVEATTARRRMLRDVGRCAAVFAAQCEPLQHAQRDTRIIGAAKPI